MKRRFRKAATIILVLVGASNLGYAGHRYFTQGQIEHLLLISGVITFGLAAVFGARAKPTGSG